MPSKSNPSGINPTEYRVLVKPKKLGEKTIGGIIIPDQAKEREEYAAQEGDLIAVSPVAFTYAEWPADARIPQVGDKVIFSKYAGSTIKGTDGEDYRVINDKDLIAVLD